MDASEILQTNHYYPFGMAMELPSQLMGNPNNAYQYNGKELNSDFGLDWLDYGARWYDASMARWNTLDLRSEHAVQHSPYAYTYNNPIMYIDPDGKMPNWIKKIKRGFQNWGDGATWNGYKCVKGKTSNNHKELRAKQRKNRQYINKLRKEFHKKKRRAMNKHRGLGDRLGLVKYIPAKATIKTTRTIFSNDSDPYGPYTRGNTGDEFTDDLEPTSITIKDKEYDITVINVGRIWAKDYRGTSNSRNTKFYIEGQLSENTWVRIGRFSSMQNYMKLRVTVTKNPSFGVQFQARMKIRVAYDKINADGDREKYWGRPWWHTLWYGTTHDYDSDNEYGDQNFRGKLDILKEKIEKDLIK